VSHDTSLVGKIIPEHSVLLADDVTTMTLSSKNIPYMFRIIFSTKCIFRIFPILRINGIAPLCKVIYGTTFVFVDGRVNVRN